MLFRNTWRGVLVLLFVCCVVALPEPVPSSDDNFNTNWKAEDIITCDVVIIGGGASGTYSAIRLRDMNQSIVLIEHKDRLGGHTETFTDPTTHAKFDIGVRVWHDIDVVKNFFARFDVPTETTFQTTPGVVTDFVDFRTGALVPGFTPSDPTAAFGAYAAQIAQYPYLEVGFDLPDPVPADLLLPFGDFVAKYNLSAVVNVIFENNQGIGDLLTTPTIYVVKLFGLSIIQGIQTGFLTTARHDNSELYEKAQAVLSAANVLLLRSHVIATKRDSNDGYAKLLVSTPSGLKLIKAKKIILTIPPTIQNLAHFDLDNTERSLFSQFSTSGYYTALIRNSSIPDNVAVQNIGADTLYNLPVLPGIYGTSPTGIPGLQNVLYGSPTSLSSDQVKRDIIKGVRQLNNAGTLPTTTPEFSVFSTHSPFEFTVPSSAIQGGFYKKLNALQGRRYMFYNGAAFHTHDSSMLWQFTEALLPHVIA
jgi:NAD(P)-binding Rossmann-like domain